MNAVLTIKSIDVAPGNFLYPLTLDHSVISCEQAASAKKIPLSHELKTLILNTSVGMVAVNLRGDRQVDLKKIKKFLFCRQACQASNEQLMTIGLVRGAVSAVLNPVWSMPILVSESLLSLEFVSTNNGSNKEYFKFRPHTLLHAPNVRVGNFDKPFLI